MKIAGMTSMHRVGGGVYSGLYLFRVFGEGLEDLLKSLDAISRQQILIDDNLMNPQSPLFSFTYIIIQRSSGALLPTSAQCLPTPTNMSTLTNTATTSHPPPLPRITWQNHPLCTSLTTATPHHHRATMTTITITKILPYTTIPHPHLLLARHPTSAK